MQTPTLAEIIAHDLSHKCADDVVAAVHRSFRLCDSQGACVMVAVSAAGVALAQVVGAIFAGKGEPIGADHLDSLWRDLMRPLALVAVGDRNEFEAMLHHIAEKPERIVESEVR